VLHRRYSFAPDLNIREKYLGLLQSHFGDTALFFSRGIRLKISVEEQQWLEEICNGFPSGAKKLMVCFGSKWPNKRLDSGTLAALLKKIAADCAPFFLFIYGDEEEKKCAEWLASNFQGQSRVVGELSLPLWQVLMWEMEGVIAVDSAALHLCGTTETPSWSVFGPSLATSYKPLGEHHAALQGTCPYGKPFFQRCPALRTCATGEDFVACRSRCGLE
jgi:heptosyltransferase-1